MTPRRLTTLVVAAVALTTVAIVVSDLFAQPGRGRGRGKGRGQDATFIADRDDFHYLLENRAKIRREIKDLDNGVETLTESDDPEVAQRIQQHVASMYSRIEEKRPIHLRDPLFAAIFRHADQLEMKVEETEHGVRVRETSDNPLAARLIQAHARVVSLFIKNGFEEVHKNHPVPE
jgi:hypothetical protein